MIALLFLAASLVISVAGLVLLFVRLPRPWMRLAQVKYTEPVMRLAGLWMVLYGVSSAAGYVWATLAR